jgi:hypothetical protein
VTVTFSQTCHHNIDISKSFRVWLHPLSKGHHWKITPVTLGNWEFTKKELLNRLYNRVPRKSEPMGNMVLPFVVALNDGIEWRWMCGNILILRWMRSRRDIAGMLNICLPVLHPTTYTCVEKLLQSSRTQNPSPRVSDDATISAWRVYNHPKEFSATHGSRDWGTNTSLNRILKTNQWHPYKFQMFQALNEHDPDRSIDCCGWSLHWEEANAGFRKSCFSVMRSI